MQQQLGRVRGCNQTRTATLRAAFTQQPAPCFGRPEKHCARWPASFQLRASNVPDAGAAAAVPPAATAPAAKTLAAWKWEESDDAVKAYSVLLGILALGNLPALHSADLADVPYFVALAVTTIYIGAHRGLTTRQRQQLTIKEGLLAPVAASVSLFGIYLLIKYFPELSPQTLLNGYFWLLGSIALIGAGGPYLRRISGPLGKPSLKITVPEGLVSDEETGKAITEVPLAPSDVICAVLAVGAASVELASGHTEFSLNNLIACLIATDLLQLLGLRSFRAAALLLAGMLAYDAFWVFASPKAVGDNVMLAVATSDLFVGPTRILFPRIPGGTGEAAGFPFSLLGLGDIAIPGLLAALALRYDASRSTDMRARAFAAADAMNEALAALEPGASGRQIADATQGAAERAYDAFADREAQQRSDSLDGATGEANAAAREAAGGAAGRVAISDAVLYQRAYFTPVMVAYVTGLALAFVANEVTGLGQPALVYLVPCTLLAVAGTAASRGELKRIWQFTDVATFGMPERKKVEDK